MGGIPWWAALIGTPIAAGKMANGVAETVDSLNKVNDMLDARNDRKQYASDLSAFRADPTYVPPISGYKNPETAAKVIGSFQKQAAPAQMDQFKAGYEKLTGTSDPRFFGDADSRAELAKNGLTLPANNPEFNTSLAAFRNEGEQSQTLKSAMENDPWALASVARDKDVSAGFDKTMAGVNIPVGRQIAADKEARIQQQTDFTEQQKLEKAAQQAEFERIAAGIGGRYQAAQPQQFNEGADGQLQPVPITAPQGKQPNVWNGLNYVDDSGNVTPRQIMPYDEARKNLLQAAGDYPMADTKEALAALEKQYGKEYTDANYKPSAVNWNGTATTDKNQLQLAAESGDPLAQKIIAAQDARDIAVNKAKAEDRRTILVNNPTPARVSGNLNINNVSDADSALLSNAIASGQLDASKVNSRTAQLYVKILKNNPSLDFNNSAATSAAWKKLEAQRATIQTFEQTASKNFDLVENLYNKNPQGTVYLLNKLKTNFNTKITGDPDTVALGRALKTALNEYAKVVTGQTGGAAVSDSARREVETLLSQADKPETFHHSIANHRQEMKNRMDAFGETISSLKGGNGANVRGGSATIAPAGTKVARKGGGFYTSDGKGGWY